MLEHFDREEDKTEIVHAKFILGSDGECRGSHSAHFESYTSAGAHSWVRKTLGIEMEGDVSGALRP